MSRFASREAQQAEDAIRDAQQRQEGNLFCADCAHARPEYINLTIGTYICELCSDVHRQTSKRRIKYMYAGDLTLDDARRMETVGNDVANRKFLATWNPRDFPEPDRRDRDSLRDFIWLKYEGNFKKQTPSQPPPPAHPQHRPPAEGRAPPRAYRPEERYYDGRQEDRARYGRERDLFREAPQLEPERARGYWASRYDPPPAPPRRPPMQPPPPPRDEYYRPPYPDRYRPPAAPDRFQPPHQPPAPPFPRMRSRGRYQEPMHGAPYEDYASVTSEDTEEIRRRGDRSRRRTVAREYATDSDEELQQQQESRRRKGKKVDRNGYNSEEEDGFADDEEPRKEKKRDKKSKKSKSKRREEEDEDYDEEDQVEVRKSKRSNSKRSERKSDRDRDSIRTASVDGLDEVTAPNPAQPGKTDFDLMSEWMGDSKDTEPSRPGTGSPSAGPIPAAMHHAYATVMAPPMSMYGGMMPMPGGGYMPMMAPGFMPGMGMPGVPPPGMPSGMPSGMPGGMPGGMPPGMPPRMPPGMQPGMMGMPGPSGMPGPGMPGAGLPGQPPQMQGLMNGMQNLSMQPVPQSANPAPPPPPPVGMPAGPPPGPPPEPPK